MVEKRRRGNHPYDILIPPGTLVFNDDPDFVRGYSKGKIPKGTEIRVRIPKWPRYQEVYVRSRIQKIKMGITDPKRAEGAEEIALVGDEMIVGIGGVVFIPRDVITSSHRIDTRLPRQPRVATQVQGKQPRLM